MVPKIVFVRHTKPFPLFIYTFLSYLIFFCSVYFFITQDIEVIFHNKMGQIDFQFLCCSCTYIKMNIIEPFSMRLSYFMGTWRLNLFSLFRYVMLSFYSSMYQLTHRASHLPHPPRIHSFFNLFAVFA